VFARKRFDLDAAVLARGLGLCFFAPSRADSEARIAAAWAPAESVVACSSVRSAFDLLLSCVPWKPGAEVLMSAVTIPHMALLVRLHGFTPVAVDVDPETFTMASADVERALTERSVAVLTAHLFGARHDSAELSDLTRARGLMLIEDCAQCYDGRRRKLGGADVELYSFGTIKTATCLGGAVALVADPTLRAAMRERQATLPQQGRLAFALKLMKYAGLTGISGPRIFGLFTRVLQALTGDFDRVLRQLTRGYAEGELLQKLRLRPSLPLLGLLAHRLHSYDATRIDGRRAAGERVLAGTRPLGGESAAHTHWLFPVSSADPTGLVAHLRRAGYDATSGASTLVAIDASARRATEAMRGVVYLPVYGEVPLEKLDELARLVETHARAPRGP
jgi:dTDP-4-amino-4,6-dideoxygalactose transaminase